MITLAEDEEVVKTALESWRSSLRRETEEVISTKRRKIDEKRESLQATNQAQASSTSRTASSSKADKVELRSNKDKTEVDRLLLELANLIAGLAKQEMGKEGKKQFVLTFDDLLTIRMHDEFERQLLDHLKTRRFTWIHHLRDIPASRLPRLVRDRDHLYGLPGNSPAQLLEATKALR